MIATLAGVGLFAPLAVSEIIVAPGDTVSELAAVRGTDTATLADLNELDDPDFIRTGQVLVVPSPEPQVESANHVVAPGETLSEIALAYGTDTATLADLNELDDPDLIRFGVELVVVATNRSAEPAATEPAATESAQESVDAPSLPGIVRTYVVQAGDTLAAIGDHFGVTAGAIAAENDLTDLDLLIEGHHLTIPSGTIDAAALALLPATLQQNPAKLALIPVFDQWAAEYGIDPGLLKAMTWVESGWQTSIVSDKGAVGIGQLMPDAVDHLAVLLGEELDPTDAFENIRMSARFLRYLIDATDGDVETALAAYHQGLASVRDHGPYTSSKNYVAATLALSARF